MLYIRRLDLYMILVLQNLRTTNPSRPIPVILLCDLLLSLLRKAAHPPVVNQTKGFCLLHRYLLLEFLLGVTTHLIRKCLHRFLVAASVNVQTTSRWPETGFRVFFFFPWNVYIHVIFLVKAALIGNQTWPIYFSPNLHPPNFFQAPPSLPGESSSHGGGRLHHFTPTEVILTWTLLCLAWLPCLAATRNGLRGCLLASPVPLQAYRLGGFSE